MTSISYSSMCWMSRRPSRAPVAGRRRAYLVVGGGVFSLAAAFNPHGPAFMLTSALAHLGGCAWLVWLPEWVRTDAQTGDTLGPLSRHRGFLVAGALAALVCVLVLGPGVSLAWLRE